MSNRLIYYNPWLQKDDMIGLVGIKAVDNIAM
jgi:hypothetical protein